MDLTETYWLNNGGAENHHVLYSANENWVGLFARIGGKMWPMRYPAEPLLKLSNDLASSVSGSPRRQKTGQS